ncbi:MAG: hypothetical protein LBC61_00305 [Candidatus Peribacteria bacterium]|jgi:hypothetical protein|nr:hypothetical protein [Candidatus Peribacteria bacterium]
MYFLNSTLTFSSSTSSTSFPSLPGTIFLSLLSTPFGGISFAKILIKCSSVFSTNFETFSNISSISFGVLPISANFFIIGFSQSGVLNASSDNISLLSFKISLITSSHIILVSSLENLSLFSCAFSLFRFQFLFFSSSTFSKALLAFFTIFASVTNLLMKKSLCSYKIFFNCKNTSTYLLFMEPSSTTLFNSKTYLKSFINSSLIFFSKSFSLLQFDIIKSSILKTQLESVTLPFLTANSGAFRHKSLFKKASILDSSSNFHQSDI